MKQSPHSPPRFNESGMSRDFRDDIRILERVSGVWLAGLFASFLAALAGWFVFPVIFGIAGISAIVLFVILWKLRPSSFLVIAGIAAFFFAVILALTASPSVFSGRDEGSYAEAALHLAESGSLVRHTPVADTFFARYGPGKALNFPGFFYDESGGLITQFPLGYIVWLGMNVSLFGIAGFSMANAFTFFLSGIALSLLLRRFVLSLPALAALLFLAFSFPFVWLSDLSLSENLAGTLFLLSALHLVTFLERPRIFSWFLTISTLLFFSLTRIEGYAVAMVAIGIVFLIPHAKRFLFHQPFLTLLLPVFVTGAVLGANFFFDRSFFITLAKAFFFSSDTTVSSEFWMPFFRMGEAFWTYGLLPIFIFAVIGLAMTIAERRWLRLVPVALALPLSLYLIHPHISADFPWALRRIIFALWPTAIFLALLGLESIRGYLRKYFINSWLLWPWIFAAFGSIFLLIPSLPVVVRIFPFSGNQVLLEDVSRLAERFDSKDLILIDRLASGDPYRMIPAPLSSLFNRQAVYFFNPSDLLSLDTSSFSSLYLVVPDTGIDRYREVLSGTFSFERIESYSLRSREISRTNDPGHLPEIVSTTTNGEIYRLRKFHSHH